MSARTFPSLLEGESDVPGPINSALIERARVVGVLDAWELECGDGRRIEYWQRDITHGLALVIPGVARCDFSGVSRDAARAAAAKAIEAGEV